MSSGDELSGCNNQTGDAGVSEEAEGGEAKADDRGDCGVRYDVYSFAVRADEFLFYTFGK